MSNDEYGRKGYDVKLSMQKNTPTFGNQPIPSFFKEPL